MIVNSINTLSTNKTYSLGSNQQQNVIANSQSFGSAPAVQQKVASHSGKVAKAVLAAVVLGTAALFSTACSQPTGGSSPIEEPIEPTEPTETLARQTMDSMLKIVDTLGLTQSNPVLSARAVNNYVPIKGDIVEFGYHDDYNNVTLSHTLDTTKSTSNKLVYRTTDIDNTYDDVRSYSTEVTKTANGISFQYEGVDHALEYVAKDGYVMVYKVKADGTKTEYERQYPTGTPGTVKVTAPDGSQAAFSSTLSGYNVVLLN